MQKQVISSVSDISVDWLQQIIDRFYIGAASTLASFDVIEGSSVTARTARIRLSYKDSLNKNGPSSLFLKCCQSNEHFINDSEYLYYTRDYAGLYDSPVPLCFDAQYDAASGAYHVLLEDLSGTHYSNKDVRPNLEHALSVATELARLHVFRWGRQAQGLDVGTNASPQIARFIAHASKGLYPILKAIENAVPAAWSATLARVFEVHPTLLQQRAENPAGQTLIHGDANPTNILSPRDAAGKTYIIDRQPFNWSLRYWLGVDDLAYMAVPFWDEEDRRRLERPMLMQYHASLMRFGVTDYTWDQCQQDYRLCIPHGLYAAVDWCGEETDLTRMRWLWEQQLRRSMNAFTDWECGELLLQAGPPLETNRAK